MKLIFEIARPVEEDARDVMRWRNDPLSLSASFNSTPKKWPEFFEEFKRFYFNSFLPPLFVRQGDERVAFLRFRPLGNGCDLSIMVAPEKRGGGIGKEALILLKPWFKRRGVSQVVAEVKKDNVPSLRLFQGAGFKKTPSKKEGIERFVLDFSSPESPVFVIAEAGSNWKRETEEKSRQAVSQMIKAAKESGADAIKFQIFRANTCYVEGAGKSLYLDEDIYPLFESLEFPYEWVPDVAKECQIVGIEFMASVFSPEDFTIVDPYVKRHKLASYENSDPVLIELMAKSGKVTLVSTGCSTPEEIAWAVSHFYKSGGEELILMQCTAKYPASLSDIHLKLIPWLKAAFGVKTGLSDHSEDPLIAPLGAIALGATVIEKHFTLSRSLKGPDHPFAIEPDELKKMTEAIQKLKKALGEGEKEILPIEEELYLFAKRGLQSMRDLEQGEEIELGKNVIFLRPGQLEKGAHPKDLSKILGHSLMIPRKKGEGVSPHHVES